MTSDINICNMALGNIGAAPIVSFSDESQTARICVSYYGHVRKYLLSAYPWSFNRRHVRLVPLPKGEEYEDETLTQGLAIGLQMALFPHASAGRARTAALAITADSGRRRRMCLGM